MAYWSTFFLFKQKAGLLPNLNSVRFTDHRDWISWQGVLEIHQSIIVGFPFFLASVSVAAIPNQNPKKSPILSPSPFFRGSRNPSFRYCCHQCRLYYATRAEKKRAPWLHLSMSRILHPVSPLNILSDGSLPAQDEVFLYSGLKLGLNVSLRLAAKYVTQQTASEAIPTYQTLT